MASGSASPGSGWCAPCRVRPEHELVRTVVHLGLDQPLILGLTRDEAADRALMLVLRYQTSAAATAGR